MEAAGQAQTRAWTARWLPRAKHRLSKAKNFKVGAQNSTVLLRQMPNVELQTTRGSYPKLLYCKSAIYAYFRARGLAHEISCRKTVSRCCRPQDKCQSRRGVLEGPERDRHWPKHGPVGHGCRNRFRTTIRKFIVGHSLVCSQLLPRSTQFGLDARRQSACLAGFASQQESAKQRNQGA